MSVSGGTSQASLSIPALSVALLLRHLLYYPVHLRPTLPLTIMSGFLSRVWYGADRTLAAVGQEAGAHGVAEGADQHAYPLAEGMSLSQWLQNVRANPLLDRRTTETVPGTADVVIIGSGVRLLSVENTNAIANVGLDVGRGDCFEAAGECQSAS